LENNCRGVRWQKNGWPKDEGIETFDTCFNECKKLESCTAFDMTPTEIRNKFRCILFGHDGVIPASSTSFLASNCYKMAGRKAIAGKNKLIILADLLCRFPLTTFSKKIRLKKTTFANNKTFFVITRFSKK
jgi:hypothetical protein